MTVALVDADILRYEIGFAAETGWKKKEETEDLPPFEFVEELLNLRLGNMMEETKASEYRLFLTEGRTFRFDIAKSKPYKGKRKDNKPWHFRNLTTYMTDVLGAETVTEIEADDMLAVVHLSEPDTIICSRDKDLRQVPGKFYSWELGRQPSFGPTLITSEGSLSLHPVSRKLTGTGLPFFFSQVLTGDVVDNIPGCPGVGPVAAFRILDGLGPEEMMDQVMYEYEAKCPDNTEEYLLEQGRLCWITRKLNEDGSPELWEIGKYE